MTHHDRNETTIRWNPGDPKPAPAADEASALLDWPVLRCAPNIELVLFLHGLKRATKMEDLDLGTVQSCAEEVAAAGGLAEPIRQSGPGPGARGLAFAGHHRWTLFMARSARELAALIAAEGAERRGGEARGAAIRRSGRLLGYPDCCAARFAARPTQDDDSTLAALAASGGGLVRGPVRAADALLNVFLPMVSPVTWYPCSLECRSARSAGLAGMRLLRKVDRRRWLDVRSALPGLTLLFRRFELVHLHGIRRSGAGFAYNGVSDALSFSGDPALIRSEQVALFRRDVASIFAAFCKITLAGGGILLEDAQGGRIEGVPARPMLALRFPAASSRGGGPKTERRDD
jgi:hypothetical protein